MQLAELEVHQSIMKMLCYCACVQARNKKKLLLAILLMIAIQCCILLSTPSKDRSQLAIHMDSIKKSRGVSVDSEMELKSLQWSQDQIPVALPRLTYHSISRQEHRSDKLKLNLTDSTEKSSNKTAIGLKRKAFLTHYHLNKPSMLDITQISKYGPEFLVEDDNSFTQQQLTAKERVGNNILFTLRTTMKYHDSRLPVLFDTWLTTVNTSNVYLVTDGEDDNWRGRSGVKYVNAPCKGSYLRDDLCCKAGTELLLIFRADNHYYDWLCHVDDDMYVILGPLINQLSKFHPRKDPVYFGRPGTDWYHPRAVVEGAKYGKPGQLYHFAVGGMYCLSRAMLELAKPYLVGGQTFSSACQKTLEPEDVTIGLVIGVMLNQSLSRTNLIYTHGLDLQKETLRIRKKLDKKIAFAYGYGAVNWLGENIINHISVPHPLYSIEEDESQFRSLHCFLYSTPKCLQKAMETYKHLLG